MAQDIATSPRPLPRPVLAVPPAIAPAPGLRPQARPGSIERQEAPAPGMTEALPPAPGMLAAAVPMPRPKPRPEGLMQGARSGTDMASASPPPAVERERRGGLFGGLFGGGRKREERAAPADGFVCGDRAIRGEELARITSRVQGCGVEAPVRVTQVDGIRLTTPATIDCPTAIALKDWINAGVRPAFGRNEVVELRIAASYICRTRNNRPGAKVSEHGRGKAVDVSGFIFADGRELSVARDYNRQMRRAHRAACGIFGTTLGPGSDGYHEDHLHFDTASYRSGPYCR